MKYYLHSGNLNWRLALSASSLALTISTSALAQTVPSTDASGAQAPATDIVVTGSRVISDGSKAPTPVMVVGQEFLEKRAVSNVADALNEMPGFRATSTPATSASGLSGAGANNVDLRSLGTNRTLTLVEGKRFASASEVDLNLIPSIMIQRADVVTGGASSSYGSDAVAGVLNLILKRDFRGVEGDVQYGQAGPGDAKNARIALHAGTHLLDDRLKLSVAAEYNHNGAAGDPYSRGWGAKEWGLYNNTAGSAGNGLANYLVLPYVKNGNMTEGGLITSGPLRGTQFDLSGNPTKFNYGSLNNGGQMVGGDGTSFFKGFALAPRMDRALLSGIADFQATDAVKLSLDINYADSRVLAYSAIPFDYGDLTINRSNAYLPSSVGAAMDANGVSSFSFGRFWTDIGAGLNSNKTTLFRVVPSYEYKLSPFWTISGYYEYGRTALDYAFSNSLIPSRLRLALDSVVDPATGQIVCRSTLANAASGCVPLNPFGSGNGSAAALAYVTGKQASRMVAEQHVASLGVAGTLINLPAGPLKVAFGGEYRQDSLARTVNSDSANAIFQYGNPQLLRGKISVKEVYGEIAVPVLSGVRFAEHLDLTGAVRYTDYSTSGSVATWKVGGDWAISSLIRLRATRSRDIRAPNITELFTANSSLPLQVNDYVPAYKGNPYFSYVLIGGNANLRAEKADTVTAGVVFTPNRALHFSVDYFDIDLKGAIATLDGQTIVDRCGAGDSLSCSLISRDGAGKISYISNTYINLSSLRTRGFDIEASYRVRLDEFSYLPGTLTLRVLATATSKFTANDGRVTYDLLGQGISLSRTFPMTPNWVVNGTVNYEVGRFSGLIEGRYVSGGKYRNDWIEGVNIDKNSYPSRFYANLSVSYDVFKEGSGRKLQVYGVINNLLDADPPIIPDPNRGATNYSYYDVLGRTFKIGARFRY